MPILLVPVILVLVEIALFVAVGDSVGIWGTLALVIGSSVLGVAVLRRLGSNMQRELQNAMHYARDPALPLADGVLRGIAGFLLFVPGFFTSSLGLVLLLPAVRRVALGRLQARAQVLRARRAGGSGLHPGTDHIVDAEYEDITPAPQGTTDRQQIDHRQGPSYRGRD